MRSVPFSFVAGLAAEFGAVESFWRESGRSPDGAEHHRSFTGFVAEVWCLLRRRYANESLPRDFAVKWAEVVGYSVLVRCVSAGPGRFAVSVPCLRLVRCSSAGRLVAHGYSSCFRCLVALGLCALALFL
jgi:hypothetical protein